jgi:hypothetical protein
MRKVVIRFAILGFAFPLFWGAAGFVFFSTRESIWTNIFWWIVYVTCPFWLLPANMITTIITPFLNAALYGGLAYVFLLVRHALRGHQELKEKG